MFIVCDDFNIDNFRPALRSVMCAVDLVDREYPVDNQTPQWRKQQQKARTVGDKSGREQQDAGKRDHEPVNTMFYRRFTMRHAFLGIDQRAHALPANQESAQCRRKQAQGNGGKPADVAAHFNQQP